MHPTFPKRLVINWALRIACAIRTMVETDVNHRDAVWGQVDYYTHTIRAFRGRPKERLPEAEVMSTLIHEILHAILQENKMLKAAVGDETKEENFVDTIANVITDTFMRNKMLR